MVIKTNSRGLPPIEKYSIVYNRNTGKFDVTYFADYGPLPIGSAQSYVEGEDHVRTFVLGYNLAEEHALPENDIQSDESSYADEIPSELQQLQLDMDATELAETWADFDGVEWRHVDATPINDDNDPDPPDEPYEPYERIHTEYDPIRYE